MKKTLSISLAGTLFWIEEDAYQTLDRYISGIKTHFAGDEEASEIVSDIESRIAEQFIETKKKNISHREVSSVIAAMGDVRDFGGRDAAKGEKDADASSSAPETKENKEGKVQKRLYRNTEDAVLGGVCSGLAAYIGTDAVWVRLAFVLLLIASGFGILVYIVLWIAMPEAKTASQHLAMTGTPVTLETLAERIKERVDEVKKDDHSIKKIVAIPLTVIQAIFHFITAKLIPLFGRIIGAIVAFWAGAIVLGFCVVLGIILTNLGGEYVDFPINELFSPLVIGIAAISGFLVIAIPFLLLALFGVGLMFRRFPLTTSSSLGFFAAWFLAVIVAAVMGVSIGTRVADFISTNPEYQEKEELILISDRFNAIEARNGVNITYNESATTSVTLAGRARDMGRMTVKVEEGVLVLVPERQQSKRFCIFCDHGLPKVLVTAPAGSVTKFTGENGVRIGSDGITSTSTIIFDLENATHGAATIFAQEVSLSVDNASGFTLRGSSTVAHLAGLNGTWMNTTGLVADTVNVSVQNGSRAEIGSPKKLNASARNGSHIEYAGTPEVAKDIVNGSRLRSLHEEELERQGEEYGD